MAKKYVNAQFHYVWDCGEGHTVNQVLKKLCLDQDVTFERYDPNSFDHMRMPGYALEIPSEPEELIRRLSELFPSDAARIRKCKRVHQTGEGLKSSLLRSRWLNYSNILVKCSVPSNISTARFRMCLTSSSYLKQHKPY